MAMSSARSFLKVGLFLGWYCQQLFMSLAISKGQKRGAGMRYPETHRSQSKQAVRGFWHVYTPSGTQSSGNGLSMQIRQVSGFFWGLFVFYLYLSPPRFSSPGCSCSCKASVPGKKSPTTKYQSSTRHSRWCSDLKTPAGGSIGKGTGRVQT